MQPTRWYVITGAPCAGKTSVIEALSRRGFTVVHEAARALIDQQLATGRRLADIKADPLAFERRILHDKVDIENRLNPKTTVFLDRGLPDSVAYFRMEGLNPSEAMAACGRHAYRRVFFFERLDFTADAVRSENDADAARLNELISDSYRQMGYELVRVPKMAVAARVAFILSHI